MRVAIKIFKDYFYIYFTAHNIRSYIGSGNHQQDKRKKSRRIWLWTRYYSKILVPNLQSSFESKFLAIYMYEYICMYIFKNSKNIFAFFILVISDKICDEISRTWSCDHVFCDTHFVHCVFVISYKVQDTLYLMTQHI